MLAGIAAQGVGKAVGIAGNEIDGAPGQRGRIEMHLAGFGGAILDGAPPALHGLAIAGVRAGQPLSLIHISETPSPH